MADRNHLFQKLCHEAVLACGPDVGAIERYVMDRLGAMDAAARDQIRKDIDRLLAFTPPTVPTGEPH